MNKQTNKNIILPFLQSFNTLINIPLNLQKSKSLHHACEIFMSIWNTFKFRVHPILKWTMTLNAHKYDLIKQTDSFDFRQN